MTDKVDPFNTPIDQSATRCVVAGCVNIRRYGAFVGEFCMPCYTFIVTGSPHGKGTSFMYDLVEKLDDTARQIDFYKAMLRNEQAIATLAAYGSDIEKIDDTTIANLQFLKPPPRKQYTAPSMNPVDQKLETMIHKAVENEMQKTIEASLLAVSRADHVRKQRDALVAACERLVNLRHTTPTMEITSAIDDANQLISDVRRNR